MSEIVVGSAQHIRQMNRARELRQMSVSALKAEYRKHRIVLAGGSTTKDDLIADILEAEGLR